MSIPDFERADYVQPTVIEGYTGDNRPGMQDRFLPALLFGVVAAALGSFGYALVGLSGWMVSIVAIAVGWLVGKAMMTGSRGIGGRRYQVAAVILTYLAVSCARVLDLLWALHREGVGGAQLPPAFLLTQVLAGPFLRLSNLFNGLLGLLILFYGLRTAWQIARGAPGFAFGRR